MVPVNRCRICKRVLGRVGSPIVYVSKRRRCGVMLCTSCAGRFGIGVSLPPEELYLWAAKPSDLEARADFVCWRNQEYRRPFLFE